MLAAFVTAIITWFGTNYFGRNLLRFWDLRLEAHKAIFVSASSQVYKYPVLDERWGASYKQPHRQTAKWSCTNQAEIKLLDYSP
jgi:hypothetical protein